MKPPTGLCPCLVSRVYIYIYNHMFAPDSVSSFSSILLIYREGSPLPPSTDVLAPPLPLVRNAPAQGNVLLIPEQGVVQLLLQVGRKDGWFALYHTTPGENSRIYITSSTPTFQDLYTLLFRLFNYNF